MLYSPGEPAGIGPDLILRWATQARDWPLLTLADPEMLAQRAQQLGLGLALKSVQGPADPISCAAGELSVWPLPLPRTAKPGVLEVANAGYVLEVLRMATDTCLAGKAAALITGPVQKSIINDAGISFSGHTEYLAERCGVAQVVMLLVAGSLRVALATTHVPLAAVPSLITQELLRRALDILLADLRRKFGIAKPRVLVAGLNPHAGEAGHLGREEIEVIGPVCQDYADQGVRGPLPADTLFTPALLAEADAVLAMYHDQGLPVLKHVGFGEAVNITLGLPIIRTSVDHGTALDKAGTGLIHGGSLAAAIALAAEMAARSR